MSLLDELKMEKYTSAFQRAGLNIIYTSKWMDELIAHTLKPFEISEQQFNVLRILKGQKGNPINLLDIHERMLHKSSNTTRLVEKLRLKGLVERIPCPSNRRKVEISITKEGLRLLEKINPVVEKIEKETFNRLTEKEAIQLGDLLEKLRDDQ